MVKYCTHCGKELLDEAVICIGCGCATATERRIAVDAAAQRNLVEKLSSKVMTNGVIWIVIAALQILAGLLLNWFILIVGVLNLISAIQDISYSKTVLQDQTGIVNKYEPLAGPIITLVYNLVIGGLIGVIGSIYYFVAIRSFVMENKTAFAQMDTPPVM